MERACLRGGVLHMGSYPDKKCLLSLGHSYSFFSVKGPQRFLLTPKLSASQCSISTLFAGSMCQTPGVHSCFYH